MSIKILPPHVIHHIAAGEVIDRPVSVIKELIENSLDSGATQIEVIVKNSGLEKIEVIDNGRGISAVDFHHLCSRYATSKLHSIPDLLQLDTYGFRGEALFSIMTVSDLQIISKTESEKFGTELITHNGKVETIQPIGTRTGTKVVVTDLFKNFPVRHQSFNLKNEWQAIKKLLEAYAVLLPHLSFRLTHNEQIIFATFTNETTEQRIEHIWKISNSQLMPIEDTFAFGKLHGVISLPEHTTLFRKHQTFSINRRWINDARMQHLIEDSLKPFVMKQKYPQYVLHLELNPHLLDVNVHPQKHRVKFLHESEIFQSIQQAIRQAFHLAEAKTIRYTTSQNFPASITVAETDVAFQIFGEILQMNDTYLIAHTSHGILLVDQHAADEKIWYNKLMSNKKLFSKIQKSIDENTQRELDDDIYQHSFAEEVHATVATIACHQAIRAGQKLSQTEMRKLIEDIMYGGTSTLTCPHGRPTYMFITVNQLERMFRRK